MQRFITINSLDDVPVDESMRLSRERPIFDGASTVSHVARSMRSVALIRPLDLHPMITINRGVHRSRLIVTVITPLMDRRD